jgi:hypothetical protein
MFVVSDTVRFLPDVRFDVRSTGPGVFQLPRLEGELALKILRLKSGMGRPGDGDDPVDCLLGAGMGLLLPGTRDALVDSSRPGVAPVKIDAGKQEPV